MPNQLNLLIEKELNEKYPAGTDYIVVGFTKLTGPETAELRKTLRDQKIRLNVVKNSIATRVLNKSGLGQGVDFLQGPSALVASEREMPELCRVLLECAKKYEEKVLIRGGVLDGGKVSASQVKVLAAIPSMPVLRAQMIGNIAAPMTALAGIFQSIHRSLACALEGIRKQKESEAPSPTP